MTDQPYEVLCRVEDVGRDEWLRLRGLGIGASEAATLVGLNPWKSELRLYAEKTGAVEPDDLSDNEAVFWGVKLEPIVVEAYRERSGRFVDRGGMLLRSTRYPWAVCTLDGWTATAELGPYWPLEIKTAGVSKGAEWLDGPPPAYVAQVAWQMLVVGAERATVACLIGGQKLVWADVERDEILERKLIHAGEQFWSRVQRREPPAPDGSESSRRTVHALFPEDSGKALILGHEYVDVADELEELKAQEKAIALKKTEAENRIKLAIGDALCGALPDGRVISWRTEDRKAYQVAASKRRVLHIKHTKKHTGA